MTRPRVLFVDDEPKVLIGLERMLSDELDDWEMIFAHSADEALGRIREAGVDVVASDVNMPGRDGFSLLAEIQASEDTRDIPVIIVTGRDDTDIKRRALALGAVDLLNKPVHPEDLIARLRSAMRLKAYQDERKHHSRVLEQKVEERTAELADSRLDILWRLGAAAEYRDEATGNHVIRVSCCCRAVAEAFGMDRDNVEMLFLASPLHDIGKIGIPDGVLLKPGSLDHEEWEIMKAHCAIGARILRDDSKAMRAFLTWRYGSGAAQRHRAQNPILSLASTIALSHHERWDGSGYPHGLKGEDIPLESRIVALADIYDALLSERPYKPALPEAEAVDIIRGERARHLDPCLCDLFEDLREQFRTIRAEFADQPRRPAELECTP